MNTGVIRHVSRSSCLLVMLAVIPTLASGQSPQQPGPIPVARLAASPTLAGLSEFSGSRLMMRTGLRAEVQIQDALAQESAAPNLKSEGTALWLSLGSTLLPVAAGAVMIVADNVDGETSLGTAGAIIASSGLYFGPAVGYWYGGASGRGWKGVGIRLGTGLVAGLAITLICGDDQCGSFVSGDAGGSTAASVIALAATGVIAFSAIYDLAKVKSHVRKANEAKLRESGASLSVLPVVSPANGGTAGLVAQVRF